MNISELTLERLNEKKKEIKTEEKPNLEEPILNVKELFKERLQDIDQITLSTEERYQIFLEKNLGVKAQENKGPEAQAQSKEVAIYGTIDLSELFRKCSDQMNDEQRAAFNGIENIRSYLDGSACNCAGKKAKFEEYYSSFLKGNEETDLFTTIKEKLQLNKITFFYENRIVLEV